MITIEEVKFYIGSDVPDSIIQITIDRAIDTVATITNNYTIDELGNKVNTLPNHLVLDQVYLHIVLKALDPSTRNSAGKNQEKQGDIWFTYATDLPLDLKRILASYNQGSSL